MQRQAVWKQKQALMKQVPLNRRGKKQRQAEKNPKGKAVSEDLQEMQEQNRRTTVRGKHWSLEAMTGNERKAESYRGQSLSPFYAKLRWFRGLCPTCGLLLQILFKTWSKILKIQKASREKPKR